MCEKPSISTVNSVLELQMERTRDYIKLTDEVSLRLIQMLNLQDLEITSFIERLERQRQDLEIAEIVSADAQPEELERVSRQRLKLDATTQALRTFENSANILAGSVIQIAQQGMSIVHGSIKTYPYTGRKVAGSNMRDLVWQGRNQAMHYETTATRADWKAVFAILDKANPGGFSLRPPYKSHAKAIFDLLGWQSHAVYVADMHALLLGSQASKESDSAASCAS